MEITKSEIPEINFQDRNLDLIWEKVLKNEDLSLDEGVKLLETEDFASVGIMADYITKSLTGDKVFFVLNRHINPTNICVLSCKFCDFAKKPGDKDAYEMSIEQILDEMDEEISEVHIVGGHHPSWEFSHYVDMVKAIHDKYPNVQIKAFTASEIDYFYRRWKITPEESLSILKEAGLDSMPGGGAEVFSDRIHKMLLPGKATGDRWLDIHRIAHNMDIKSKFAIFP